MQNKLFGMRASIVLSALAFLGGCGGQLAGLDDKNNELAHTLGDIMGSADETLSRSAIVFRAPDATLSGRMLAQVSNFLVPLAQAVGACGQEFLSTCVANVRTISYDDCRFGPLTLRGSVRFVFDGSTTCSLDNTNDTVRRVPVFSLSGRTGGTLGVAVVNSLSSGQIITRSSAQSYTYAVSGLRRYLSNSAGTRIVDMTINTSTPFQITGSALNTGTNRAARVMTGGTLQIVDSISGETTSLTPQALKWESTCSCPTSGSWTGQVITKESVSEDFLVEIKGCGNALLTRGSTKASLTLERCAGV